MYGCYVEVVFHFVAKAILFLCFFFILIYNVYVCVRMFTFSIRNPQAITMREGVLSCIYSCL